MDDGTPFNQPHQPDKSTPLSSLCGVQRVSWESLPISMTGHREQATTTIIRLLKSQEKTHHGYECLSYLSHVLSGETSFACWEIYVEGAQEEELTDQWAPESPGRLSWFLSAVTFLVKHPNLFTDSLV